MSYNSLDQLLIISKKKSGQEILCAKHNLNKSNPSSLRYAGQVKFYRSRQYFFRKSKGLNPPLSLLQEGDIVFSCNIRFVLLSSQIKCVVPSAEGKVGWVWRLLLPTRSGSQWPCEKISDSTWGGQVMSGMTTQKI